MVLIKKLAETGVMIFLNQIFRDNFFHADMHRNIFVSKKNPENPGYIAIDCVITDLYQMIKIFARISVCFKTEL